MHVDIDKYAHLKSPVHNWDTRFKIISLMSAIVCVSMLKEIGVAIAALFLALFFIAYSRIPVRFVLQKIKYPFLFLLPLFLFLPLSSGGRILYNLDCINIYYDGIYISFLILFKAIAIITLFNLMLGTSTFDKSAKALLALKIPDKLVNLILFTYRYIFVYLETLRKMRVALTLRGFRSKNSVRSLRNTANLVGSILVRSFEQTERVYKAMLLRGFAGDIHAVNEFEFQIKDILKTIAVVIIFGALVAWDVFYRN